MRYEHVITGIFLDRPNRFIAHVIPEDSMPAAGGGIPTTEARMPGQEEADVFPAEGDMPATNAEMQTAETVHVKNTGRCRELLQPGTKVYLAVSDNPARKTRCDLIGVEKLRPGKPPLMVNMDSQAPNAVAEEWLRAGADGLFSEQVRIQREVTYGKSRFDFYLEDGARKAFLEVKGVTLEYDGVTSFPDAPTERGVKHIRELMHCMEEGYEAYILFVVQMKEMRYLVPRDETDPAFGRALREAAAAGVRVLAMDCLVTADTLRIDAPVPVVLDFAVPGSIG